ANNAMAADVAGDADANVNAEADGNAADSKDGCGIENGGAKNSTGSDTVDGTDGGADSNVNDSVNEGGEQAQEEFEPGVGINDCAFVSRRLSKWLDKEDFIDEVYTLEICSKGYLDKSEGEN
ncbi:MAG: hypothetical protein Q4B67_07580, partial [Eubacteriales bacterium]|nr:hypothetical protein [Eubacteriales bacterium]